MSQNQWTKWNPTNEPNKKKKREKGKPWSNIYFRDPYYKLHRFSTRSKSVTTKAIHAAYKYTPTCIHSYVKKKNKKNAKVKDDLGESKKKEKLEGKTTNNICMCNINQNNDINVRHSAIYLNFS